MARLETRDIIDRWTGGKAHTKSFGDDDERVVGARSVARQLIVGEARQVEGVLCRLEERLLETGVDGGANWRR